MAFVSGYENDIFISYAHIDNEPVITGKPGWVDFFQDILRKRIRVRLGAEIEVFRDPQLRRYGKFSDELNQKLSASAAFICVLSPRYVQSDWCLHELSQFCRLAGSSRVIKVVKTAFDEPRDDQQLRPLFDEIGGILDSRFYREDARTGLFKDLQPEIIADDIPAFIDLIDVVAQNLVGLLKHLRESQAGPSPPPPPTAGDGGGGRAGQVDDGDRITVYLAETTKDLVPVRDEIRTELTQYDCRVLPDQPLPQDADELTDRVRACLEQAHRRRPPGSDHVGAGNVQREARGRIECSVFGGRQVLDPLHVGGPGDGLRVLRAGDGEAALGATARGLYQ